MLNVPNHFHENQCSNRPNAVMSQSCTNKPSFACRECTNGICTKYSTSTPFSGIRHHFNTIALQSRVGLTLWAIMDCETKGHGSSEDKKPLCTSENPLYTLPSYTEKDSPSISNCLKFHLSPTLMSPRLRWIRHTGPQFKRHVVLFFFSAANRIPRGSPGGILPSDLTWRNFAGYVERWVSKCFEWEKKNVQSGKKTSKHLRLAQVYLTLKGGSWGY